MHKLSDKTQQRLQQRLVLLYGDDRAPTLIDQLNSLVREHVKKRPARDNSQTGWNQAASILITYGDSLQSTSELPVVTLHEFLKLYVEDAFSYVHLLPFFPYSSDDGFSVIDYYQVNPDLGEWEHIEAMGEDYGLMFDFVLNHISRESVWFTEFLNHLTPGKDYFITVDPRANLSQVIRPRSSSLLVEVPTRDEVFHVWATFSHDQVDLNYANPDVLLAMLEVLLFYIRKGARILRLDAVAFLWKEIGTSCMHLPKTHEIIKLFRDVLDDLEPGCRLLTETNVPHKENISYFGNYDEAHMVYQFSLPPLLLHALQTGQTHYLTEWARSLDTPPRGCTYFNFTASHDGIGLRPLEGIIPKQEIDELLQGIRDRGGFVSKRLGLDGLETPYEMNITYLDALRDPSMQNDHLHEKRFFVSQILTLSLQGIPGVYIHSLLGTPNDMDGVERTGRIRSINRRKWDINELGRLLADEQSDQSRILRNYKHLLNVRSRQKAFHPDAPQEVYELGDALFGLKRTSLDSEQEILCLYNFTRYAKSLHLSDAPLQGHTEWQDLITKLSPEIDLEHGEMIMPPYAALWLTRI
jgi:sucrose phosphorylase